MENNIKQKVLITGSAGFVAHQILDYLLETTDYDIVALDGLTYAGSLKRITDLESYKKNPDRVKFVYWNLRSPLNEYVSNQIGDVDYILHLAANSSVEHTIKYPVESVLDNVLATVNMLEFARAQKNLKLFNFFSTDESNGSSDNGEYFDESAAHRPSNPYSAGKAGGEDYSFAYFKTYGVPVFITKTMNVAGFSQGNEKYIPTVIRCVKNGETLPVYSNKDKTKAGSRFWISAYDVADAISFLLKNATPGERYNIVGTEMDNLDLAKMIAERIGKPLLYKMYDFHSSRPGHDLSYRMSGEKMAKMGWNLKRGIENEIKMIKKFIPFSKYIQYSK